MQDYPADRIESYQRAFSMMKADDPDAVKAFATLVGEYKEDALARFHLQRLLSGEHGAEINIGKLAA